MTNNLEQDSELFNKLAYYGVQDAIIPDVVALIKQQYLLAFERGRAVGKYQAADSLYGHTTTMYVFKDGDLNDPKIEYPERIKELLKDCEALMNNNAREYGNYIKKLQEQL